MHIYSTTYNVVISSIARDLKFLPDSNDKLYCVIEKQSDNNSKVFPVIQ